MKVVVAIAAPRDFHVGEEDWHAIQVFADGVHESVIRDALRAELNEVLQASYTDEDFDVDGLIVWEAATKEVVT